MTAGTTLGIPASYFALLRYPDLFSEKVGNMAVFRQASISVLQDAMYVTTRAKGTVDVLEHIATSCNNLSQTESLRASLMNKVDEEAAWIRGLRNRGEATNEFVLIAEEKLAEFGAGFRDGWELNEETRSRVQIAVRSLMSSIEMDTRYMRHQKVLYRIGMQTRQNTIQILNRTLSLSMWGLQIYFASLAGFFGVQLHHLGVSPGLSVTFATALFAAFCIGLNKLADRSVRIPQALLRELTSVQSETLGKFGDA